MMLAAFRLLFCLFTFAIIAEGATKKIIPGTINTGKTGTTDQSDGSGSSTGFGGISNCENATVICNHRTRLVSDVFGNQNNFARPYCGNDDTITVTLDIALRQLMELDEPSQVLKIYAWIRMSWKDCTLAWNASYYGGIDNIIIPYEAIWTPDLSLYDSAAETIYGLREFRPQVHSDGSVYYNFPSIIESQCLVNVRYFPLDTQNCSLTFGSWAYHGLEVDFRPKFDTGDLSTAQISSEWELKSFSAMRKVTVYRCCPEPYPDVRFHLEIKRKPLFYIINIIIPTFLITLLAMLVFVLPVESGEKIGLSVTIMLALSVFQLLVSDSLPPSAETIPLVALFFDFTLILCGFATVIATVSINVYFTENRPMTSRTRNYILRPLAKIACVGLPSNKAEEEVDNNNMLQNGVVESEPQLVRISKALEFKENGSATFNGAKNREQPEEAECIPEEWKSLSIVIDRISLIIFIILFLIGTAIIVSLYNY